MTKPVVGLLASNLTGASWSPTLHRQKKILIQCNAMMLINRLIQWYLSKPNRKHRPQEIGLGSSLKPRFMSFGFTNSVQIRPGFDCAALSQYWWRDQTLYTFKVQILVMISGGSEALCDLKDLPNQLNCSWVFSMYVLFSVYGRYLSDPSGADLILGFSSSSFFFSFSFSPP